MIAPKNIDDNDPIELGSTSEYVAFDPNLKSEGSSTPPLPETEQLKFNTLLQTHIDHSKALSHSPSKNAFENHRISNFLEKQKTYQTVREESLQDKRLLSEQQNMKNYTTKPTISKKSKAIAQSLNQSFEERVIQGKNRRITKRITPTKAKVQRNVGPPSCYNSTKCTKEVTVEFKAIPNINTNSISLLKDSLHKEFNSLLEKYSIKNPVNMDQFISILKEIVL